MFNQAGELVYKGLGEGLLKDRLQFPDGKYLVISDHSNDSGQDIRFLSISNKQNVKLY